MSNPAWQKGMQSPNVEGRKKAKQSATTVQGKVERFMLQMTNYRQLKRIWDGLSSAKDRMQFLIELLPYTVAKKQGISFENMTDEDLNKLYNEVMSGFKANSKQDKKPSWFDEARAEA